MKRNSNFNSISKSIVLYSVIIIGVFVFIKCKKELPISEFEVDKVHITEGDIIQFYDMSLNNPIAWKLGSRSIASSVELNMHL